MIITILCQWGAMRTPSATRLASLVYGFAEGLAHQDSGERGNEDVTMTYAEDH
jgi:hypothetical protein